MAPISNKRIVFKEYLKGPFIPGQTTAFDDSQTIDVDSVPLNGGILLKTLVLSLEPYTQAKMRPGLPISNKIGDAIYGFGIGVVVRSEDPAFQVRDHLYGLYPFQEYSVQNVQGFHKIHNKHDLPWSVFIGVAGMPGKQRLIIVGDGITRVDELTQNKGQTAYLGWKEYSHAKKGEVAFVTSGAGAVGSLVIQLAKRDGMKVIASAGSDDKVQFLKDLGADVAFNYKTTKTSDVLQKEGPIDVYWDNVGGESLEAALDAAAKHARFIECGMLSGYLGDVYPIRNLMNVVVKEILIKGFIVRTLMPKYLGEFTEQVPALLASKELTYREDVTKGLENAEAAFLSFLKGAFIGKSVLAVADD